MLTLLRASGARYQRVQTYLEAPTTVDSLRNALCHCPEVPRLRGAHSVMGQTHSLSEKRTRAKPKSQICASRRLPCTSLSYALVKRFPTLAMSWTRFHCETGATCRSKEEYTRSRWQALRSQLLFTRRFLGFKSR